MSEQQKKIRLSSFPIASSCLILILILSAYWSINSGSQLTQNTLRSYIDSGLFEIENPLYLEFHSRRYRLSDTEQVGDLNVLKKVLTGENRQDYAWIIMQDRAFAQYLDTNAKLLFRTSERNRWQTIRQDFNATQLKKLPAIEFGLVPQQSEPRHFVSHLFVEQDWGRHLLNLALLSLALPFIERFFGRSAVFLWFFTSGGIHAGLYYLYASPENAILMGVSGAASGLVGVLLATITVAHSQQLDSVKARVLTSASLLGLWLIKSALLLWFGLCDWYLLGAELGVLFLSTALAVLLFKEQMETGQIKSIGAQESGNKRVDWNYRQALQIAFNEICQFNFRTALEQLASLGREYPGDLRIQRQLFRLALLNRDFRAFALATDNFIDSIVTNDNYREAKKCLAEIRKRYDENSPAGIKGLIKLFRLFITHNDLSRAEHCYQLMLEGSFSSQLTHEAASILQAEFQKRALLGKAD